MKNAYKKRTIRWLLFESLEYALERFGSRGLEKNLVFSVSKQNAIWPFKQIATQWSKQKIKNKITPKLTKNSTKITCYTESLYTVLQKCSYNLPTRNTTIGIHGSKSCLSLCFIWKLEVHSNILLSQN